MLIFNVDSGKVGGLMWDYYGRAAITEGFGGGGG